MHVTHDAPNLPPEIWHQVADHLGPEDLCRLAAVNRTTQAVANSATALGKYVDPWPHTPSLRGAWLSRFSDLSAAAKSCYRDKLAGPKPVPKISSTASRRPEGAWVALLASLAPAADAILPQAARVACAARSASSGSPTRVIDFRGGKYGHRGMGQKRLDEWRLIRHGVMPNDVYHYGYIPPYMGGCEDVDGNVLPELLLMAAIRQSKHVVVGDLLGAGLVPPAKVKESYLRYADSVAPTVARGWTTQQTPIGACLKLAFYRPSRRQTEILHMLLAAGARPNRWEFCRIALQFTDPLPHLAKRNTRRDAPPKCTVLAKTKWGLA